jgi:acetyl-CoA synthetase
LEPDAGIYFTGDGARRDADGYFWVMGRIDDVVNVAGHRLGTMEVESALVSHPAVAEAAVVGRPDDLKGQAIAAFVTVDSAITRRRAPQGADGARGHARSAPSRVPTTSVSPTRCRRPAVEDHAPAAARHRRGQGALGDTTTLEDYSVSGQLREEEE